MYKVTSEMKTYTMFITTLSSEYLEVPKHYTIYDAHQNTAIIVLLLCAHVRTCYIVKHVTFRLYYIIQALSNTVYRIGSPAHFVINFILDQIYVDTE